MQTDVLVVGAGPTGLMLANQLARRGVRAQIIDRHPGPALQTRALGVRARTLEIYAQLGIVDEALALGKRATGANLWAQGRFGARVPLCDIGRDLNLYPFLLILGQDDNEKLLGDALRRASARRLCRRRSICCGRMATWVWQAACSSRVSSHATCLIVCVSCPARARVWQALDCHEQPAAFPPAPCPRLPLPLAIRWTR